MRISWMSVIAELKRRNVFRAVVAYLVTGWLLIELAGIVFPAHGFPPWAVGALVLAVGAGLLPLALAAWFLEVTPAGLAFDNGSGAHAEENARTARRLEQMTVVVALLFVAVVVAKRFVPEQLPTPLRVPAPAATVSAAAPAAAVVPVDPRSIAVMAFANLSPDPGNEYFADGIAEELLNVLAKIDGLKVASRTSAFSFKGSNASVREIGRELGVAHVLEGSVRMQGNTVRITAQLIDTRTDQHLWSQTYDRTLDDIFVVQEEIAIAITSVLKNLLGVQTVSVARPTADLEAWELYLRARPLYFQRASFLFTARELLQQAVARDPRFAQAWAMLAATHYVMPSHFGDIDVASAAAAAGEAADRAIALDATQSIAWAVRAMLAIDAGQRDEAARFMQTALDHDPNDATAWLWNGIAATQAGRLGDARHSFERAYALDPLVGINSSWLGIVKLMQNEIAEGVALLARARELGVVGDALWALIQLDAASGPNEKVARKLREYLPQDPARPARQHAMWSAIADALADPAKRELALATIQAQIAANPQVSHSEALQLLGYHREAITEELRASDGYGQFLERTWFPAGRALREQPEFLELAERRGLLAYWKQHGYPDYCRLVEAPVAQLECSQ